MIRLLLISLAILNFSFTTSERGKGFIKEREDFKNYAYWDHRLWAIGYGNTYYETGQRVKKGDYITRERGEKLFEFILKEYESGVSDLVSSNINQSQFDALVSYSYNRGLRSLERSRLLKMINQNAKQAGIKEQFSIEWGSNENYKNGLIKRRRLEAEMYFSDEPPDIIIEKKERTFNTYLILIILLLCVILFLVLRKKLKVTITPIP